MKQSALVLLLTILLISCDSNKSVQPILETDTPIPVSSTPTQSPASTSTQIVTIAPSPPAYAAPPNSTWHIQYTGNINTNLEVAIYNLDLFDTDPGVIADLHTRGIFVMCYFSAGSFEDWRPDINAFPADLLGAALEDWEGERWLDIRRLDVLTPIIEARLGLAVEKACDGVDPDNVNGYTNETGFPLTYEDQLAYNIWLAEAAHARGLSIGLKNDIEQIPDLLPYFDWQLNEECFSYEECRLLLPFIEAGKPVFHIEYELSNAEFCEQAKQLGFQSIRKNWELDEFSEPCL